MKKAKMQKIDTIQNKINLLKQKRDAYTYRIKSSPNLQIYRKFIHLLLGAIILLIGYFTYLYYGVGILIAITFLCLIILIFIDFLRVECKINFLLYNIFTKEKEKRNLHALTFAFLAAVIALTVYSFQIALAALSMSIFSDGIAAIIGIKFGKHRIWNGKSIEGSIASLIVNLLIGYFILKAWYLFIPMALVATLTELMISHMDDNFVVPIFAGFIGQIILLLISIY